LETFYKKAVRVISKSALTKFWPTLPKSQHESARTALYGWYGVVADAEWENFSAVKATFNTADWVGNGKIVFDVGGNKYRIVCLIGFKAGRMLVLFVGTHRQYDAIDVRTL
jgi:mRNA interferase HigB